MNESADGDNESAADDRMKDVDVVVEQAGNGYTIHPVHQGDFRDTVRVDLDVQLPKTASVTLYTPHGDINASAIAGTVNARTENGDIEIHDAGSDVVAQLEKGDARITGVAGNVSLKGRGNDVEIGDVTGNATLDGPFLGSTVVSRVKGTTRVSSPWAELTVAQLTGRLELDSSDIQISDVAGPARLQTHNKDIDVENVAGQLDVVDTHGDVKVVYANPPRESVNISNESGEVDLALPGEVELSDFRSVAVRRSGQRVPGSVTEDYRRGKRRATGRPVREQIRSASAENHDNHKLRYDLVAQIFVICDMTPHARFVRLLVLRSPQTIQRRKELRERNCDALGIADGGIAFGSECCDRKRHRDTMIAVRINFRAVQFARGAACDAQPIGEFFHLSAHGAQTFGECRDAVALFHAQFLRVVNLDSLLGERAKRGEHRQLVDHFGDLRAGDCAALDWRVAHRNIADQFPMAHLHGSDADRCADRIEKIEHARAGGIQAHVVQHQRRTWKHERRANQKYGRRKVARAPPADAR